MYPAVCQYAHLSMRGQEAYPEAGFDFAKVRSTLLKRSDQNVEGSDSHRSKDRSTCLEFWPWPLTGSKQGRAVSLYSTQFLIEVQVVYVNGHSWSVQTGALRYLS